MLHCWWINCESWRDTENTSHFCCWPFLFFVVERTPANVISVSSQLSFYRPNFPHYNKHCKMSVVVDQGCQSKWCCGDTVCCSSTSCNHRLVVSKISNGVVVTYVHVAVVLNNLCTVTWLPPDACSPVDIRLDAYARGRWRDKREEVGEYLRAGPGSYIRWLITHSHNHMAAHKIEF